MSDMTSLMAVAALEELLAERKALLAHVHRVKTIASDSWHMSVEHTVDMLQEWEKETPESSLARLKDQWQAEALREASHRANIHELSAGLVIEMMLEELRRQAEEVT